MYDNSSNPPLPHDAIIFQLTLTHSLFAMESSEFQSHLIYINF